MDVITALFLVWVFVVLVGHGSWVAIRALLRAFTSRPESAHKRWTQEPWHHSRSPQERWEQIAGDIQATYRVINRLMESGAIDAESARQWRLKVVSLEVLNQAKTRAPDRVAGASEPGQADQPLVAELVDENMESRSAFVPRTDATLPVESHRGEVSTSSFPITPVQMSGEPPVPARPVPDLPASELPAPEQPASELPALSKSEVIRSFLAAHNIRWGELVAGILIVVCSIGLVINLWSTLIHTHRVIPSLIFLCGNAAIFSAGLYTLSRWRLRHTSRAVLVIATLLVPLSVLAGLAAAGTAETAIQLTDPITLAAILIGAAVYLVFLRQGGNALVGRGHAAGFVCVVAGPAIVLPMMPAAARWLGSDAGWMVGVGAIAVAAGLINMVRYRRRATRLGVATARNQILQIAIGAFSLAVLVGYAVFATRDGGFPSILPVAIAIVPALVTFAGAGRSLATSSRQGTHALVGSVICMIALGLSWLVLPMGINESRWVWSWAASMAISGIVVGWLLNQPRWLAASTVPLGLATTFSSTVWFGDAAWYPFTFWHRMIGGEPMVATAVTSMVVAAIAWLDPQSVRRRWTFYAAIGWSLVSVAIASTLTFSPQSWLGAAPWWSVTVVLALGLLVAVVLALRRQEFSFLASGLTVITWCSIYEPLRLGFPPELSAAWIWTKTAIATAITLVIIREFAVVGIRRPWNQPRAIAVAARRWCDASVVAALAAVMLSAFSIWQNWKLSAWGVGIAAMVLLWVAVRTRSTAVLRCSQTASIILAAIIGYGTVGDSLYSLSAWSSNIAPWYWAVLLAAVTGVWYGLRELLSHSESNFSSHRSLAFLSSGRFAADRLIDGWCGQAANWLIALGAVIGFSSTLGHAAHLSFAGDHSGWTTPLVATAMVAAVLLWMKRWIRSSQLALADFNLVVLMIAAIVWLSRGLITLACHDPTLTVILVTTCAASGCVVLHRALCGKRATSGFREFADLSLWVSSGLITGASAVLWKTGWYDAVTSGLEAEALPTLTVSLWWAIASVAAWSIGNRRGNGLLLTVSSTLLPLSAAILVPVFWQVSPVVWIQTAALTSLIWVSASRRLLEERNVAIANPAHQGSCAFAFTVGIGTAVLVCLAAITKSQLLTAFFGPIGALLSTIVVVLWCLDRFPIDRQKSDGWSALPWTIAGTLLAGHATWFLCVTGIVDDAYFIEIMLAIWGATASASAFRYVFVSSRAEFWHALLMVVGTCGLTAMIEPTAPAWFPWLAVAVCISGGLMVAAVPLDPRATSIERIVGRMLACFVVFTGGYFLVHQIGPTLSSESVWTAIVGWCAGWVVIWRVLCAGSIDQHDTRGSLITAWVRRVVPDAELSIFLFICAIGELVSAVTLGHDFGGGSVVNDSVFALRILAFAIVVISAATCARQRLAWPVSLGLFVVCVSLVSVQFGFRFDVDQYQRLSIACVSAGFTVAILAHSIPWITTGLSGLCRQVGRITAPNLGQLIESAWHVTWMTGAFATVGSIYLLEDDAPAAIIQLTIGSIVLVALAIAELADTADRPRLRHASVSAALVAIGLWASVDPTNSSLPVLTASMRWLVATVLTIPFFLFVAPRLLGTQAAARWRPAFHRGALVTAVAAGASVVVMLSVEFAVRGSHGIDDVPLVLVVGAALTLAALSGIAAFVAVISGPMDRRRFNIELTDHQRSILVVAAQAVGGIAWLHTFLCKPDWAFIGFRSYWPYIVMLLAFASVGATQWASRRGDRVLSETLRRTALYLPLLPVIGFWFSGSAASVAGDVAWSWDFAGGRVPYELLLALGAVYYVGLSALWKGWMPRVAAVVLGNVALWVVLVQQPGWSFLSHPQAWLIPPAVCVLVASHFYRDRIAVGVNSAIRYSATLVIYISSTADMLLQQIGTSVSGPIILVTLALLGMATGVILRVRPFLYLGATFVFIGVTSMVWHATESIDAVWPWWVFGIGTGVCLLAGLMAIEKNKPKLQRLANSLAAWES